MAQLWIYIICWPLLYSEPRENDDLGHSTRFFLGTPSLRNTVTPFKERSPVPIHEICWGGYPVEFHMFISFVSCTSGATWVLKSRYLIDLILRTSILTLGYSRHDVFWHLTTPKRCLFLPEHHLRFPGWEHQRSGSKTAISYDRGFPFQWGYPLKRCFFGIFHGKIPWPKMDDDDWGFPHGF
jgi:hypothetical protein